jgi:broad specificity phosphatase PhoE
LQRAARTCELAGFGGVAETDAALVEWDYEEYEGLRSADILNALGYEHKLSQPVIRLWNDDHHVGA